MVTAGHLAGFFAAHAIWSVSDGATLIPILAYTSEGGKRQMTRFADNDLAKCVALGKDTLAKNPMDANDAVFLFDGRIPVNGEKLDAIIEIRTYFSPDSEAIIAIPYTPKSSGGFRVHKPKVLAWDNCQDFDMHAALEAFWKGVAEHEKGVEIWNRCLDESK